MLDGVRSSLFCAFSVLVMTAKMKLSDRNRRILSVVFWAFIGSQCAAFFRRPVAEDGTVKKSQTPVILILAAVIIGLLMNTMI